MTPSCECCPKYAPAPWVYLFSTCAAQLRLCNDHARMFQHFAGMLAIDYGPRSG